MILSRKSILKMTEESHEDQSIWQDAERGRPQVRAWRTKRDLSQEQLAAKLQLMGYGIGQKAISRIETGDRVIADYELLLLAKALGVSPVQLLGISDT